MKKLALLLLSLLLLLFFMSIIDAWLGEIKAGTCNGKVISTVVISGLCCV